jgi:hypothetical protein
VTVANPLTASLSASEGTASFTDNFSTAGTSDLTGPIASWSLSFGDGTSTSGSGQPPDPIPTHAYPGIGTYAATLDLTDSNGFTAQMTTTAHSDEQGYDWTQYDASNAGGSQTLDPLVNVAGAAKLALRPGWPLQVADPIIVSPLISSQPIVTSGMVYWGDWSGYEHATPADGGPGGWSTDLGTTIYPPTNPCSDRPQGVIAAGTIADNITINGQLYPSVLFVAGGGNDTAGGGYARVYAINALTGTILWTANVEPAPNFFLYASPLVYTPPGQATPSVYQALSRRGDSCGAAYGGLVKLDAGSGTVQALWAAVPNSKCNGNSVWGTPSIDASSNSVFLTTGNGAACKVPEPYAIALVKLDASDLSVTDSWQLPKADQISSDDDFGTTPLIFSGTVTPGGTPTPLVGALNKNGTYYVWNRNDLAAGPIWSYGVSGGNGGAIGPAGFDGTHLYIGGPITHLNGKTYAGILMAFNVNNLGTTPLWTTKLGGQVLTSVTVGDGILAVGAGNHLAVVNSATGKVIKALLEVGATYTGKLPQLVCPPTIANGVLYQGGNGYLYAYTVGGV